jgi:hypothetical protein
VNARTGHDPRASRQTCLSPPREDRQLVQPLPVAPIETSARG